MLHFCPTKPMPFWNNMDLLTCQPSKLDATTPLIHIWNFGFSGVCSCHFFTLPCKHDNSENSPWAFHLLENINRSAQSGVSSNLWSYRAFPQKVRCGMALLPVFSPVCCFQNMAPHIQVGLCLIARSQNYTNLPDSWICGRLRVFAGVCGFLLAFCGYFWAQLYAFIFVGARDMRMAWYVPGTQPGCKPCSVIFKMSIVVIVWPLGSKTRQTSRIRRDSENWAILGHIPKLPKIIDRRNAQGKSCTWRYLRFRQ